MRSPCDETENQRRLNVTIHVEAWLLWAAIGVGMVVVALAVLGFYVPEWALWAAGFGLPLVGMLLTGLGIWTLVVVRSWHEKESNGRPRKSRTESSAPSGRIFPGL
jgi:hypothetical protein